MNSIKNTEYTTEQKELLSQFTVAELLSIVTRCTWTKKPTDRTSVFESPSLVQQDYLKKAIAQANMAPFSKPSVLQEQALTSGSKISVVMNPAPHTAVQTPEIIVERATGSTEKWPVDVIPVQEKVLAERPGIGRMTYFCSSLTIVTSGHVAPLMTSDKFAVLEVRLFSPSAMTALVQYIEAIFVNVKRTLPMGASGPSWLDMLYCAFRDCSMDDYNGLHCLVLSKMLLIGSNKNGTFLAHTVYENIMRQRAKQGLPKNKTLAPISNLSSTVRQSFDLCAYWVGDLPANRQVVSEPVNAVTAIAMIESFVSNRGGYRGPLGLLSGRLSIGLPSLALAKYEEVMHVMAALDRPYNIFGLPSSFVPIWEMCVSQFHEKMPEHWFVVTKGTSSKTHLQRNAQYYDLTFDYRSVSGFFKPDKQRDQQSQLQEHLRLMEEWAVSHLGDEDIWVGNAILPFQVPENTSLESIRIVSHPICYDGRGVFSRVPVKFAKVIGFTTNESGEQKKLIEVFTRPSSTRAEHGKAAVRDCYAVPGYLVHPPAFKCLSVSNLMSPFKDVTMLSEVGDNWEFISAKELDTRVAQVASTPVSAVLYDSLGNVIVAPVVSVTTTTTTTVTTTTTTSTSGQTMLSFVSATTNNVHDPMIKALVGTVSKAPEPECAFDPFDNIEVLLSTDAFT